MTALVDAVADRVVQRLQAVQAHPASQPPTPEAGPTWLTTAEAAERLRVAKVTLESWRAAGRGPKFSRLGRAIRYATVDLDQFGRGAS